MASRVVESGAWICGIGASCGSGFRLSSVAKVTETGQLSAFGFQFSVFGSKLRPLRRLGERTVPHELRMAGSETAT